MTPVLVATDLDGTLVYSRRSAGTATCAAELHAVEERNGTSIGWTTRAAADLLLELARCAVWVPATARTLDQFRRLALPRTRWAVCAQGGVLLVDGEPDPGWEVLTAGRLAGTAAVGEVAAGVATHLARLPPGTAGPLRVADGLFLAAGVDRARVPDGWADELSARCAARGWRSHLQARKLHVLPDGLDKVAAVEEVRRRAGADGCLAAGDSTLDAALLDAADAGIRPAHGELHALGHRAAHVTVTATSGIGAGEEILGWLLDRARGGPPLSRAAAPRARARGRPRAGPGGSG